MKKIIIVILCFITASCSTTKLLRDDEYRLAENKVVILNSKDYTAADLQPYIKQKPNSYYIGGWNPFLYVYNWSSGRGTKWDKFVEKLGVEPVVFDSTLVQSTVKGMQTHLEYMGYYDSKVDYTIIKDNKKAKVRYDVTLGKQYLIHDIDYIIKDSVLAGIVAKDSANFTLFKGDPLSQEALEFESDRLATLFRKNGYYGFTKNYFFYYADTNAVKNMANLVVNLENYTRNESAASAEPHKQFYINNVAILPQNGLSVRAKFLENLNTVKPGTLYNETNINNTYQRFTSIRLFSTVNIQLEQEDSALVDCRILLSPSKLQGVKFNLESSFNSSALFGITPSLSYYHKNIFGGGEMLTLGFRGNFQFKLNDPIHSNEFAISSSISFPQFLLLPERLFTTNVPRTDISLSYNYQSRPEYTRNIVSTSYGYNWSMKNKFFYQLYPIQMNIVRIFDMSPDFYENLKDPYLINAYQNHFDFGAGAIMFYTTDPSINPKHSYFYLRWQTDIAGNLLSLFNNTMETDKMGKHLIWGIPYSQYVRSEVSLVQTLRFGKSDKFGLAGRVVAGAGYAYGNSYALPFEKFFYAGGANSLRGWQSRSVGPGCAPIDSTFSIANQSGDMRMEANLEFRFPMFWKLQGALFADAGNIWNIKRESLPQTERDADGLFSFANLGKSIAVDWGLGLRLDFNLLLVRLDLGIKAYNPVTQQWHSPKMWFDKGGYAFHFGIGYPF